MTLPTSSSRTISFYSVDQSLYLTSGTVTGNIYALKADGSTLYNTAGQFITFSIAYTAPCTSFNPMVGVTGGTWTGNTYTLGQAAEALTFTDLEATSHNCVHSYVLADVSPEIITMSDTSARTISLYSVDIALYYTSATVTGKIYAVKADGTTKYNTAGEFITFSISYTAPCNAFNPMTGLTTGTFTGSTYTISSIIST